MQAHTCRLCKFIPCQKYTRNNSILKECKVECEGDIIKIQLALSSFLVCVLKGSSCMKNKISCFTFSSNNKAGLLWLMLLQNRTSSCTRTNRWSQSGSSIQLRTCCGLCLLTLTLVSLLHGAGSRTQKQLITVVCLLCHCSVFPHSWYKLSRKSYTGLSPDSKVSNTSRECFCCTMKSLMASKLGSYNSSAHSMGQ